MENKYNLHLKGYVGDWDFSAEMVDYILSKHENEEVNVLIESLGGRVHEAISISESFALHGNVNCHYVGMNASSATIASLGAKHVSIDRHALYLVHKCKAVVDIWKSMNADELQTHIESLLALKDENDTLDECIASRYAAKCKKPKEDLLELMCKGAWLTAEQALEWGFVDEITDRDTDTAPQITAAVVEDLARAGIPEPPAQRTSKNTIANFFTNLFSQFGSQALVEPHTEDRNEPMAAEIAAIVSQMAEVTARIESLERSIADAGCSAPSAAPSTEPVFEMSKAPNFSSIPREKFIDAFMKNLN